MSRDGYTHKPRIAKLEAEQALAQGAGLSPYGNTLVYRPGGVPGENVFTTEASLRAARDLVQGPVTIQIDDSIVSPAVFNETGWDLNNVLLTGIANGNSEFATLEFGQGATILGTGAQLVQIQYLTIQSVSTAVVWPISGLVVLITDQVDINVTPNVQAFFKALNGSEFSLTQYGGLLGDNTHNLVTVDTGGSFTYLGELGAFLERSAVGGAGAAAGATGTYTPDCATHPGTQGGTWTQTPIPATATLVNAAPLGSAATVHLDISYTASRSKKLLIIGTMSGLNTMNESVDLFLEKDGVQIGALVVTQTVGSQNQWWATPQWIDIAADYAAHTYSIAAVGTSLIVGVGQAALSIVELD